jgi:hypothetical protein
MLRESIALKFSTHFKKGKYTNSLPAPNGQDKAISFEGIDI